MSPTTGCIAMTGANTRQRSDRKSTRLNSSHLVISDAVFCLKKKKTHRDGAPSRDLSRMRRLPYRLGDCRPVRVWGSGPQVEPYEVRGHHCCVVRTGTVRV